MLGPDMNSIKPVKLHIVHDLGGGVDLWCRDYCRADVDWHHLILKPFRFIGGQGCGLVLFAAADESEPIRLWVFQNPVTVVAISHGEYAQVLAEILTEFSVESVMVSSLIGHSLDALATGLPTIVVTHDYFPICPAVNAYFDAPCTACDDQRIVVCQQRNSVEFDPFKAIPASDRMGLRHRFVDLVDRHSIRLVSPTEVTRSNWIRLVPALAKAEFDVIPHGHGGGLATLAALPSAHAHERPRVLVLGSLSPPKGFQLLRDALPQILDIADLYLVGAGELGRFFSDSKGVQVIDAYTLEQLPGIVAGIEPDASLLTSVCAETFSYALSELMAMGIPPIVTDVGSFAERVEDGLTGYLYAPNASALVAKLRSVLSNPDALTTVRQRLSTVTLRGAEEMVSDYRRLLPTPANPVERPTPPKSENQLARWARIEAPHFSALVRGNEKLRHRSEIQSFLLAERAGQLAHTRAIVSAKDAMLADFATDVQALQHQVSAQAEAIARGDERMRQQDRRIGELDGQLGATREQLGAANGWLSDANQRLAAANFELASIHESTSWKVTRPLRVLVRMLRGEYGELAVGFRYHARRLGRAAYWRLPWQLRRPAVDVAYRWCGFLFKGFPDYERWRAEKHGRQVLAAGNDMVDLDHVKPLAEAPNGRIAIHLHLFYPELATEFADQFRNVPFPFDLFVSVVDEAARQVCAEALADLAEQLEIVVVENRGRDMAPMFCAFGDRLRRYDFIAHVHGKKSLYNDGRTLGWREYLLNGLFGSSDRVRKILGLLSEPGKVGIVYPQTFRDMPYLAHTWLANKREGAAWCHRLAISPVPQGYFDFPVGSMFWARTEALAPLFDAGIRWQDFPAESGQTDGTLAHCLERLLGLVPRKCGFRHAVLRDTATPSWSRWRAESFFTRTADSMFTALADPRYCLVIFDIFDTLLVRPLIDPERVKDVVARRIGGDTAVSYLRQRAEMEHRARGKAGRDVDLEMVYREWLESGALRAEELSQLRAQEEASELASVTVRADAAALLRRLADAGKTVVLASDTFLPQALIERMLAANGITGWQRIYCSSAVGLRKDSGALFRHILAAEDVVAAKAVMVGDNERSDFQIPADLGMGYSHLLRSTEVARCLPRWQAMVEDEKVWHDLDSSAALGLILRRRFSRLFYPDQDSATMLPDAQAIGYCVVGPLVLSFVQWLARRAVADGMERLYFLAREGAVLHRVYCRWREATGYGPPADYLVLSRRTVTVPLLRTIEDLRATARARFFPNDLAMFLRERYGLTLTEEQATSLDALGVWKLGRAVEVRDQNIEAMEPLLEHLQPWVAEQSAQERQPLLTYLNSMGLGGGDSLAVVDVGYSGSIQARLNRLLERPIHGYYFITNSDADKVGEDCRVTVRGCFGHGLPVGGQELSLYRHSFELEKLLSSDERQVIRYRMAADDGSGRAVVAEFRPECEVLDGARRVRAELQAGLAEFIDDALELRAGLLPDFVFPPELAARLFDALVDNMAAEESAVLRQIVLDDYYCGRGIVS